MHSHREHELYTQHTYHTYVVTCTYIAEWIAINVYFLSNNIYFVYTYIISVLPYVYDHVLTSVLRQWELVSLELVSRAKLSFLLLYWDGKKKGLVHSPVKSYVTSNPV